MTVAKKTNWIEHIVKTAVIIGISVISAVVTYSYASGHRTAIVDQCLTDVAQIETRLDSHEVETVELRIENLRAHESILRQLVVLENDLKWIRLRLEGVEISGYTDPE